MSNNQIFSGRERGFYTQTLSQKVLGVMKWSLLSLGVAVIFLSIPRIVSAGSSSALCGVDSYVDCSGGVRCTATDQVGCTCYDANDKWVSHHSCKEAAPEEEGYAPVEDIY
jgi:hypothetical protein